jgi:glycosyltransferase involved in cell wall biosynthesis
MLKGWPIVYHYQTNAGLGAARNKALEFSSGSLIAFIDQDDIWMPVKLEKQVPLFDKPKVGLVFCDTYFFSDSGIIKQLYTKRKPPCGNVFRQLLNNYFLSLEAVVIRKRSLEGLLEWFDPRFNMIEEADLFLRIAHDWKLDYVDEVLTKWRVHQESSTFCNRHLFPQERELLLEKFSRLYSDFKTSYGQEINKIKAKNQYQFALLDWENGNGRSVRRRLRPYLAHHTRYLLPYFMSFFPYKIYNRLVEFKP